MQKLVRMANMAEIARTIVLDTALTTKYVTKRTDLAVPVLLDLRGKHATNVSNDFLQKRTGL